MEKRRRQNSADPDQKKLYIQPTGMLRTQVKIMPTHMSLVPFYYREHRSSVVEWLNYDQGLWFESNWRYCVLSMSKVFFSHCLI